MTKKMLRILLLIIITCGLLGCNNKNKKDIIGDNKENQELDLYGIPSIVNYSEGMQGYVKYDINCDEILNAVDVYDHYFISSGTLYEVNFHKKFSDSNTNCRVIDNSIKYKRFLGGDNYLNPYLLSEENILYKYEEGKILVENSFKLPQKYINKLDDIYASRVNYSDERDFVNNGKFDYFLLDNNNIYYLGKQFDKEQLVFTVNNNEKIISLYGNIIKTNTKYYSFYGKITNEQECTEYADVECQKEIKFYEDGINKYYDKVKFYKSPIVIDDNNNIYACGMDA